MSALLAAVVTGAVFAVGFLLGREYGFRRALDLWRKALDQPIGERTSKREGEIK